MALNPASRQFEHMFVKGPFRPRRPFLHHILEGLNCFPAQYVSSYQGCRLLLISFVSLEQVGVLRCAKCSIFQFLPQYAIVEMEQDGRFLYIDQEFH